MKPLNLLILGKSAQEIQDIIEKTETMPIVFGKIK